MKCIKIELLIDDLSKIPSDIVIRVKEGVVNYTTEIAESREEGTDFFSYMHTVISNLKQQGSIRTAEAYESAIRSFRTFYEDRRLPICKIGSDLISSYEHSLRQRHVTLNTCSFYMRILRAVYNRAVSQGLTTDMHPFTHVYTSIGKTEKRAIGLDVIRRLAGMECKRKNERLARDLFLFSFYTRGMSFVDMAYLTKQNLSDGYLCYTRSKTGQRLEMRWEPMMQRIVNENPTANDSPYLLPIITNKNRSERSQYRYRQYAVNKELKILGKKLGLRKLTMYVARHSWASIAKSMDVPIEVISRAMGHTSEQTTHIYLRSIENERIDEANHQIITRLLLK